MLSRIESMTPEVKQMAMEVTAAMVCRQAVESGHLFGTSAAAGMQSDWLAQVLAKDLCKQLEPLQGGTHGS